jgi:predicted nucleotidyltransferase
MGPALEALEDRSQGLRASSYFSQHGVFARFDWPDWPDSLNKILAAKVRQFHEARPDLKPVRKGTAPWQAVFRGWRADPESAAVIAQAFSKNFSDRVHWVKSYRDTRGRIGASCMVRDLLKIPPLRPESPMSRILHESAARQTQTWACSLQLSWKDSLAVPPGTLSVEDQEAFQASVQEVFEWASSRIQPILDALHDKLKGLYGERFRGLYVFGSYARPDAGIQLPEDSDLDVALLLSNMENSYKEIERYSDIVYDLSLEHGLAISVIPIREEDYRDGRTNFTRVISEYAIPVK